MAREGSRARRIIARWAALAVAAALLLVLAPEIASACPSCNDAALGHEGNGEGLARGFYWSILFMLGAPFTLVGGVGAWLWYHSRNGGLIGDDAEPSTVTLGSSLAGADEAKLHAPDDQA